MTISPTLIIGALCSLLLSGFVWVESGLHSTVLKDHELLLQIAERLRITQGNFAEAPIDYPPETATQQAARAVMSATQSKQP